MAVVFGVAVIVFVLIHLVPGDPVDVMLGESAQPADKEALRQALGLDQSLYQQFLNYFKGLVSAGFRTFNLFQAAHPRHITGTIAGND